MLKLFLLIVILLCSNVYSNQNSQDSEATNQILRSWVPWWPKNENFDFNLRSTPEVTPILNNSTITTDDAEISNSTEHTSEDTDEVVDGSQLKLIKPPSSPLDSLKPKNEEKSENDRFFMDFDQLGDCPRDCSTGLRDALSIILQDMSHIERYHKICGKYHGAIECINEDKRCGEEDRGMFEMMTSGLNYMCVEQEMAFNSTIKCIDDESTLVQSECEDQCQTRNFFMNWIMRSTMQGTIQQGVNGIVGAATGGNPNPFAFLQTDGAAWKDLVKPPEISSEKGLENFRSFTNDICKIGDCMLDCLRSKFNTRCEGSAGTLLSEMFVRPIAASQNKLTMLRPVLGIFMPEHCSYVYSSSELKKHRIDATMDSELKRMYAEKYNKEITERAAQDQLLSNLVPLDSNGVPLPKALPGLKSAGESPLDVSVKSLDQLIMEMYSKNESRVLDKVERLNVTETDEPSDSSVLYPSSKLNSTVVYKDLSKNSSSTVLTTSTASTVKYTTSGEASGNDGSSEEVEASGEGSGHVESRSGGYEASGEASGDEDQVEASGSGSSGFDWAVIEDETSGLTSAGRGEASGDYEGSAIENEAFGYEGSGTSSEGSGTPLRSSRYSEGSGDSYPDGLLLI